MSHLNFSCTMCGKCCTDHSLPLTVDEAIAWLEDDGEVHILCEAVPWPQESPSMDERAAYMHGRSFAAMSDRSPIRVTAALIGVVTGPCRNLGPDLKCRIYERRPLVCRIYPAEVNPFYVFKASDKGCPPEAWGIGKPLLSDSKAVDPGTCLAIEQSRQADRKDAPRKSRLCRLLEIDIAALTGEGFVIHRPERGRLLETLKQCRREDVFAPDERSWRLYSTAPTTVISLQAQGLAATCYQQPGETFWYVPLKAVWPQTKSA